jgi:hypothetical protein
LEPLGKGKDSNSSTPSLGLPLSHFSLFLTVCFFDGGEIRSAPKSKRCGKQGNKNLTGDPYPSLELRSDLRGEVPLL